MYRRQHDSLLEEYSSRRHAGLVESFSLLLPERRQKKIVLDCWRIGKISETPGRKAFDFVIPDPLLVKEITGMNVNESTQRIERLDGTMLGRKVRCLPPAHVRTHDRMDCSLNRCLSLLVLFLRMRDGFPHDHALKLSYQRSYTIPGIFG
jgi:hypothetical protein